MSSDQAGERARLFVALELPTAERAALARWSGEAVGAVPAVRQVAAEALHVTLCFLGWRESAEIDQIGAACATAVQGADPLQLSFSEAVWLPQRRPRVLAVGIEDSSGGLARIQASVASALSAGGWYVRETRPFMGHVTVARLGRGARVRGVELPPAPTLGFEANRVTLFRSRLGPAGARYEVLRAIELRTGDRRAVADPVAVVRAFHVAQREAYAGGSLDPLRSWLTDDVVWHVPGHSRIAGQHRGIDAVLSYFATRRRMTDETFRIKVHGLSPIGDRVVQLAGGTALVSGREVSWETVGIFRVADGRIAECWLVPFDLYAFDEIWRG